MVKQIVLVKNGENRGQIEAIKRVKVQRMGRLRHLMFYGIENSYQGSVWATNIQCLSSQIIKVELD